MYPSAYSRVDFSPSQSPVSPIESCQESTIAIPDPLLSTEYPTPKEHLLSPSETNVKNVDGSFDDMGTIPASKLNFNRYSYLLGNDHSHELNWIPITLRWYFLALPTASALALGLTVAVLLSQSNRNHGFASDDGTSMLLFGWRFTPTLIAVLYVQQVAMLFEDIKRTEPFSRLTNPSGAEGRYTIFQAPRAWWSCFLDGLSKKKNGGRRSWLLTIATLLHIIAFLGISPLSASLLVSTDIPVPSTVDFRRMATVLNSELPLKPNRETYFRTIGNLLQNVTTSMWLPRPYMVMPFSPESSGTPLLPVFSDATEEWRAETLVFTNELECTPLLVTEITARNRTFNASLQNGADDTTYRPRIIQFIALTMESSDGCAYTLELSVESAFPFTGGAVWTNLTTFFLTPYNFRFPFDFFRKEVIYSNQNLAFEEELSGVHFLSNYNSECRDREILLATTPWIEAVNVKQYWKEDNIYPIKFLSNRTLQAHICASTPYMAKMPVIARHSPTGSNVIVDATDFQARREVVPESLIRRSSLQELYIHQNWSSYVKQAASHTPDQFGGIAALLAAFYGYDGTAMAKSAYLRDRADQIRQTFFSEMLLASFEARGSAAFDSTLGKVMVPERRIVVVIETAVSLIVLFSLSFVLLCGVFWLSRPARRPLHLSRDPYTIAGVLALVKADDNVLSSLPYVSSISPSRNETLKPRRYTTSHGYLQDLDSKLKHRTLVPDEGEYVRSPRKRSSVLRVRYLFGLFVTVLCVTAAVTSLYILAQQDLLYQTALVYQAEFSILNKHISTIAPYSIVPTVIAVAIGLWWSAFDKSFRVLQPFLLMSRKPTTLSAGLFGNYHSSYWAWAAIKAALQKDWILFAITFGSTLCQILTIAMAALFERDVGYRISSIPIQRDLELQQVPHLLATNFTRDTPDDLGINHVLQKMFIDTSNDWMYSAVIQLTLNGTQPVWSSDEWSFVPVDVTKIADQRSFESLKRTSLGHTNSKFSFMNISISTSAIRARVDCTSIEEVRNTTSWITESTLSVYERPNNRWNSDMNPQDWDVGYVLNNEIFADTDFNTSMFITDRRSSCCSNATSKDSTGNDNGTVVVGYWSPVDLSRRFRQFEPGPYNFTAKWIYGQARNNYFQFGDSYRDRVTPRLVFHEVPSMQALTCLPIIETAEADVTVDADSGRVLSYKINDKAIKLADSAWNDPFVLHNLTGSPASDPILLGVGFNDYGRPIKTSIFGDLNITTSYGSLFLASLLSAADLEELQSSSPDTHAGYPENLQDMTFNIRDREQGINTDFMTYAIYSMADKNPTALLNATIFAELTQKAFQTFFQHFVSSNVSMSGGGRAYQPIGTTLGPLGSRVKINRTDDVKDTLPDDYGNAYPVLSTNRSATATVSTRIDLLHMSPLAAWLSISILIWLALTTITATVLQRSYLRALNCNFDTIADVLICISQSDNLLRLVHRRGIEGLKEEKTVRVRFGWFRSQQGNIVYGIEAEGADSEYSVRWVKGPDKADMSLRKIDDR